MSDKKNNQHDDIERVNGRWKDGRVPKVLCTAHRTNGDPCNRPPIKGSNVCSTHGGRAPAVRAAAQVRILMSSDIAVAKLVKLLSSKDERVVLAAARDLADRANLAGTQNIEVGVAAPKSFLDFVGEAIIDVEEDDDEPLPAIEYPDVVDAEIVTDDEPPLLTRHDRAAFAEVERARERRVRPGGMTDEQRARAEAQAMAELKRSDAADRQADVDREREAMLLAKANGTWNPSSRGDAMREAARDGDGKRRARVSDATFSEDRRRKRRRE